MRWLALKPGGRARRGYRINGLGEHPAGLPETRNGDSRK